MDHRHHGQSQPLHLSSLPAATAAHIQHSSSHLTQVSQPQPIFISTPENRQIHSDLIHRRRIATTRRNFALGKLPFIVFSNASDNLFIQFLFTHKDNMRRNWRYQFQEHVWTPTTSHHTHSNHHQQQVSCNEHFRSKSLWNL